jgi:hypothetical protein
MGAHLIDHPVWGLKLGLPSVIETTSTPFNGFCYPNATKTDYLFPARNGMPEVKLVWYDGGLLPPRPEELGEERLNGEGGVLYIGSKGRCCSAPTASSRGCCRSTSTTTTARPKNNCAACRTRITK